MRLLTLSKQYPNAAQPRAGLFVERRLLEVLKTGGVESKVVSPLPWFPGLSSVSSEHRKLAAVPAAAGRTGVEILHPRYLWIPRFGMTLHPLGMALALRPVLQEVRRRGYDFDLIDAHFLYPDGVAAALLGRWFDRPVVMTARGSDVSQFARYRLPRAMMMRAATSVSAMVAVCQALKDEMVRLGMDARKINVIRNGVDLQHFRPEDRREARRKLGWPDGPTLISVGGLIVRKGHHATIAALKGLPGWRLVLVGSGPEEAGLKLQAQALGVRDRVLFTGEMDPRELPTFYSAADISVLASSREGWANVLLESMACGTPVVATAIWGTPEVVRSPAAGRLVPDQDPAGIAAAVTELAAAAPSQGAVRAYAENFAWDEVAVAQRSVYQQAIGHHRGDAAYAPAA